MVLLATLCVAPSCLHRTLMAHMHTASARGRVIWWEGSGEKAAVMCGE